MHYSCLNFVTELAGIVHPGFQTLGEEYVNILQVDPTQRKIPSHYVSRVELFKYFK